MGSPETAEILLESPTVVGETAEEDDSPDGVSLQGTMFHDGLNANAWGLTEEGAEAIASSLEGSDLTAGHPPVMGSGFTRSIHQGPGTPIGTVDMTDVAFVQNATMAGLGGGYTAEYTADVLDVRMAQKFRNGLMVGGDYGVSVGITADEENAICSVCQANFAECKHFRGEEVDDKVAGPLYTDGDADHLAVVYIPAFKNASIDEVSGAMFASTADEFFGKPFDGKAQTPQVSSTQEETTEAAADEEPDSTEASASTDEGLQVTTSKELRFQLNHE